MSIRKRIAFQALTFGIGMAGTALAKLASNKGWEVATSKPAPQNPAARKTTWQTAVTYAALTGAVAAVMGVVGRRAAAGVWRKRVGPLPQGTR